MSYGKVHSVFWQDEKIETLSDRAALLSLFLISGPHRTEIGCFQLGVGAITDNPRFAPWGVDGVSEALKELSDIRFIIRDERTGWTFIRNALKHDPIQEWNAAAGAAKRYANVPANVSVRAELYAALNPQIEDAVRAEATIASERSRHPRQMKFYPLAAPSDAAPTPSQAPSKPLPTPQPQPEPQPEPKDDTAVNEIVVRPAPAARPSTEYAFKGEIIRLTAKDLAKWQKAYSAIPDLTAELTSLDDWIRDEPPKSRGKWFHVVSAALKKRHTGYAAQALVPKKSTGLIPMQF